jgi:hypothetical protein
MPTQEIGVESLPAIPYRSQYGDRIRAAYRAARTGKMPSPGNVTLVLGKGRKTSDPAKFLLACIARAQRFREAHGDNWQRIEVPGYLSDSGRIVNPRYDETGQHLTEDIETIADWWHEYSKGNNRWDGIDSEGDS